MKPSGWEVLRGIAVRFGIVLGALFVFPFPLGVIPKTDWLAEHVGKPLEWLALWFNESVLQLGSASPPSGSGDRPDDYGAAVLLLVLAALATAVWSALDRRRTRYPRLVAAVRIGVRYYLALTLISYGLAKVFKSQMPDLRPGDLDTPLGDLTPMGLAWAFMGYSTPYSVFAGMSEVVAGCLLLWRRTEVFGALIAIAVMTNVVAMNLCFDIPVKQYSAELLILAIVVIAPVLRRLIAAAMGHAVPELPPRARMSPRWERARWVVRLAVLAAIPMMVYAEIAVRTGRNERRHTLYGGWIVDSFAADGVERPPLGTDHERWSKLELNGAGLWMVGMTGERSPADLAVDATHGTLAVTPYKDADRPGDHEVTETWHYTQPSAAELVIDGEHGGKRLRVALHRAPPSRLMTYGFHWVHLVPPRARDRKH